MKTKTVTKAAFAEIVSAIPSEATRESVARGFTKFIDTDGVEVRPEGGRDRAGGPPPLHRSTAVLTLSPATPTSTSTSARSRSATATEVRTSATSATVALPPTTRTPPAALPVQAAQPEILRASDPWALARRLDPGSVEMLAELRGTYQECTQVARPIQGLPEQQNVGGEALAARLDAKGAA